MRKSLKLAALAGVLALGTLSSGCYGPFHLTRNLHHWNGQAVENQWGKEGLYLLLTPIYGLTIIGDSLIFNSIQFWGGENPIKPST